FPAVVTAHFVPVEGQQRPRTTILIKFAEEVILSWPMSMLCNSGKEAVNFSWFIDLMNISPANHTGKSEFPFFD
ncbi:hypothetical protein Goari_001486, partial [Gossypium aridum]|nr:hypothetical protein [Gossypium aridum]